MKQLLLLFLLLSFNSGAASEYFLLGKTTSELTKMYSRKQNFSVSDQELSFQSEINGVSCLIVYRLQKGESVSALCFVRAENLKFVDAIGKYSVLTHYFFERSTIKNTSLRLNGIQILGRSQQIDTPLNHIRISGEWTTGYDFEARLDGSFTDPSIESSNLTNLSITISRSMLSIPGADNSAEPKSQPSASNARPEPK